MLLPGVLLPGMARAQGMNAQLLLPAPDGYTFTTLEDSALAQPGAAGGVVFSYAKDPLVFRYPSDDQETALLSSVATLDLLGAYTWRRYRFALDVPLNPVAQGHDLQGGALMGDIKLGAKTQLIDRMTDPLGVSVDLLAILPTGNEAAWLGTPGLNGALRVSATTGREVLTTANVLFQTGRAEVEEGFSLGGQRAGGSA